MRDIHEKFGRKEGRTFRNLFKVPINEKIPVKADSPFEDQLRMRRQVQ